MPLLSGSAAVTRFRVHSRPDEPDFDRLAFAPILPASEARTFRSSMLPALEVLTPDQAAARVRQITDGLPVTDFWFYGDFGAMPSDIVDRHLELLFGTLRPALRASRPT